MRVRVVSGSAPGHLTAAGVSMPTLATNLSMWVDRVVVDRTGLRGAFDLNLRWMPDGAPQCSSPCRRRTRRPRTRNESQRTAARHGHPRTTRIAAGCPGRPGRSACGRAGRAACARLTRGRSGRRLSAALRHRNRGGRHSHIALRPLTDRPETRCARRPALPPPPALRGPTTVVVNPSGDRIAIDSPARATGDRSARCPDRGGATRTALPLRKDEASRTGDAASACARPATSLALLGRGPVPELEEPWQANVHSFPVFVRASPRRLASPLPQADRRSFMTRVALLLITLFAVAGSGVLAQEATHSATSGTTLNLNSATLPQLEALPGIGRSTAERIIEYRQKNGGFKRIEDLMNVRGIGEKNFLKLKPLITVARPRGAARFGAALQRQTGLLRRSGAGRAVGRFNRRGLRSGAGASGYTLVECLIVVTLLGLIAAATVPPVAAALERSRTLAAARFLQSRMMLARAQAVSRGAVVALRLTGVPGDTTLSTVLDGNRNGVLQADIGSGIDVPTGTPTALADLFRGVTFSPVTTSRTWVAPSPRSAPRHQEP